MMSARLYTAALLIAIAAGPAMAQTTTSPGTTTAPTTTRAVPADNRDDDSNWGWLGLLGLAGLAPLFMRKDRQGNVHADTRR